MFLLNIQALPKVPAMERTKNHKNINKCMFYFVSIINSPLLGMLDPMRVPIEDKCIYICKTFDTNVEMLLECNDSMSLVSLTA